MVLNRKCVVEEFDCIGYVFGRKFVYFLILLVENGEFLKFIEILDFLLIERENFFCMVMNMFFFSIGYMIKDFELVLGIVLYWIKEFKL